jgi:nitroreductase
VSCRRYLHKNVPADIIDDMLSRLACCPNGGNKQLVEYTLIDDVEEMDFLRSLVGEKMDALAERGIFPEGFDRASYEDMKHWEETVRPDMFFCGAPHLLIPHGPADAGEVKTDVNVAGTYFELLCASRGLGAVMMTFPAGVMALMPEVKNLLKIPENHAVGMMIGFGYPEIPYARGMQRRTERSRIHRLKLKQEEVR